MRPTFGAFFLTLVACTYPLREQIRAGMDAAAGSTAGSQYASPGGSYGAAGTAGFPQMGQGVDPGSAGAGAAGGASASVFGFAAGIITKAIDRSATILAGISNGHAARWTATTGTVTLPLPRATDDAGEALDVSGDGWVTVGWTSTKGMPIAVRWVGVPGMPQPLGFARPGDEVSRAIAVSEDGSTVVGTSGKFLGGTLFNQATFRWKAGVMTVVEPLAGDDGTEARAVSADASTIAGVSWSVSAHRQRVFVWNVASGIEEVGSTGAATELDPVALSADGSVLIGDAFFGTPGFPSVTNVMASQVFRWTHATGTVLVTESGQMARAGGVSDDGTIIGGANSPSGFFLTSTGLHELAVPTGILGPATSVLAPGGRALAGSGTLAGGGGNLLILFAFDGTSVTPVSPSAAAQAMEPLPVAFSADGHTLVANALSGTVILSLP